MNQQQVAEWLKGQVRQRWVGLLVAGAPVAVYVWLKKNYGNAFPYSYPPAYMKQAFNRDAMVNFINRKADEIEMTKGKDAAMQYVISLYQAVPVSEVDQTAVEDFIRTNSF